MSAELMPLAEQERLRRWRLILGETEQPGAPPPDSSLPDLDGDDAQMDRALQALYDSDRRRGLGSSAPNVPRWLGDIRRYFPVPVVQLLQRDALVRLKLDEMLLQPETLASVEPDVSLVATLLSLKSAIPAKTRATARQVVQQVALQVERRLRTRLTSAVRGALARAARTNRPRPGEIDWPRTILKNLQHYQPDSGAIIPERMVGFTRRSAALRDVILCVDQSGSMAGSVVYAGILGSVLASVRSLKTRLAVFDTEVVDLTPFLNDPVDLLFGAQLGGGTDIGRALTWCAGTVTRPLQTTLFLISDLFDGGDSRIMLSRVAELVRSGVQVIVLLALDDAGTPAFHHDQAAALAALGVPAFGCTPDQFPGLLAAALRRQDLQLWAAREGIVVAAATDRSRETT